MIGWQAASYRLQQFWRGWRSAVTENEMQTVRRWLTSDAYTLFTALPKDARRHSLNVLAAVQSKGQDDRHLAAAALLHDVGKLAAGSKGQQINLWLRGLLVLGEAFAPQRLQQMAHNNPQSGWRYLLYVHFSHPQIGAEMARQAGCSERTCWLIAHHQDSIANAKTGPSGTPDLSAHHLAVLQWADNQN